LIDWVVQVCHTAEHKVEPILAHYCLVTVSSHTKTALWLSYIASQSGRGILVDQSETSVST